MRTQYPNATYVRVGAFLAVPLVVALAFYAYVALERRPPTLAMCVAQADHRIALHNDAELPSIAKWIASTRQSMIDTCRRFWTRRYVRCLTTAPTLAAVEQCERVGRVR